jgi:hypothetical protein
MDRTRLDLRLDSDLPAKPEFENDVDATCFWFTAAVVFAVLAAGVIVYRADDSDVRMAANDAMPAAAAQSDPIAPPPIIRQR